MSFIKFSIKSVRTDKNGKLVRATIRNRMASDGDMLSVNEIPYIMATLMHSHIEEDNNQFTYTFPLKLN